MYRFFGCFWKVTNRKFFTLVLICDFLVCLGCLGAVVKVLLEHFDLILVLMSLICLIYLIFVIKVFFGFITKPKLGESLPICFANIRFIISLASLASFYYLYQLLYIAKYYSGSTPVKVKGYIYSSISLITMLMILSLYWSLMLSFRIVGEEGEITFTTANDYFKDSDLYQD